MFALFTRLLYELRDANLFTIGDDIVAIVAIVAIIGASRVSGIKLVFVEGFPLPEARKDVSLIS